MRIVIVTIMKSYRQRTDLAGSRLTVAATVGGCVTEGS